MENLKIKDHPAKYTKSLLPIFESILEEYNALNVLDCFAGTGRIHSLSINSIGIEIEPEWAFLNNKTILGDATNIPFIDCCFDSICTSPTYGNRMAGLLKLILSRELIIMD